MGHITRDNVVFVFFAPTGKSYWWLFWLRLVGAGDAGQGLGLAWRAEPVLKHDWRQRSHGPLKSSGSTGITGAMSRAD